MINKKNISKVKEPAVPYGENIPTMQMVRAIRDELSELYWKNPQAYLEETNRIAKEFMEKHGVKKK